MRVDAVYIIVYLHHVQLETLNKYCGTQIIFLGHKIYSYQRANPSTNAYEAAVMIISGNAQDTIIFSRISMVCADKELLRIRIGLQDEYMDEHCSFDLSNMGEIDEPANSHNIELVDAGSLIHLQMKAMYPWNHLKIPMI